MCQFYFVLLIRFHVTSFYSCLNSQWNIRKLIRVPWPVTWQRLLSRAGSCWLKRLAAIDNLPPFCCSADACLSILKCEPVTSIMNPAGKRMPGCLGRLLGTALTISASIQLTVSKLKLFSSSSKIKYIAMVFFSGRLPHFHKIIFWLVPSTTTSQKPFHFIADLWLMLNHIKALVSVRINV